MNIDSLVAINIINNDTKLLINEIPILYYWDGEGNLLESIFNNQEFIDKYFNNLNYNQYINLSLTFFYFKYDENENEVYTDNKINISDYLLFSKFNSKSIINELLVKHLLFLYNKSMKEEYKDIQVFNDDIIIDIYKKIKLKYQDKLQKPTFINWIRSELLNKDNINNTNTNFIIDNLTNILSHES